MSVFNVLCVCHVSAFSCTVQDKCNEFVKNIKVNFGQNMKFSFQQCKEKLSSENCFTFITLIQISVGCYILFQA